MRIPLTKGQIISLWRDSVHHKFQIDSVIGDGASCIAYSAHKVSTSGKSLNYRIKECYPFRAHISRKGQQLVWEQEEEKTAAFGKMCKVHELIIDLRNNENVGNNITSAELYEGNGTLYSIMEVNHALTYDQDSSRDLYSILETMRVLAEVVGNLHEQGFLHLDIKPDNFLVTRKPSVNIWLFDADSITAMEDIRSGRIHAIPFSESWASPEQWCNKSEKLCPATDLYAIGAILFKKVMGREVECRDCGLFADWDFDEDIFEDVNPKIKRYLRNIFKKTLAVNVARRYQSASELAAALKEAREIAAAGRPYLVSDCPLVTTSVVGRDSEIKAIAEAFRKNHVVFLHGEGGIGKSTLALAYAKHEAKQYDAILFLRYRGSLEEALSEIEIQNYDEDNETKRRRTLKSLLDKHILLIVDNFDVTLDEDPFLSDLLRYRANILFTSRTDFSGELSGDVIHVEVGKLSESNLLQIFSTAARQTFNNEECAKAEKLFSIIDYHTYAAEVLGKKLEASGWSIDYLTKKLTDGLLALDDGVSVYVNKDEQLREYSITEIFRVLYRISDLNDNQQQVLRNMYLMQFLLVDKATFQYFTLHRIPLNAFNNLVRQGFLQRVGKYFCLHPIVAELIANDLTPNRENCGSFFAALLFHELNYYGEEDIDVRQYINDFQLLESFFLSVDLTKKEYYEWAVDWLIRSINAGDQINRFVGGISNPKNMRLYDNLYELTFRHDISNEEKYKIISILLKIVYLDCCEYKNDTEEEIRNQIMNKWFLTAKQIAMSFEDYENRLDCIYSLVYDEYDRAFYNIPPVHLKKLYSERPSAFLNLNLNNDQKKNLGIEAELAESELSPVFYPHLDENTHLQQWRAKIKVISQKFQCSESKTIVAQEIAADDSLLYHQKVALIEDNFTALVKGLLAKWYQDITGDEVRSFLNSYNWQDMKDMLRFLKSMMESQEFREDIDYDEYELIEDALSSDEPKPELPISYDQLHPLDRCELYNAIISVIEDNRSLFNQIMNRPVFAGRCYSLCQFDGFTDTLIRICAPLEKCHYIVPIMDKAISDYYPENDEHAESIITLFEQTVQYSKRAADEIGKEHSEYLYYLDVAQKYQKRIDDMTGKHWVLKE